MFFTGAGALVTGAAPALSAATGALGSAAAACTGICATVAEATVTAAKVGAVIGGGSYLAGGWAGNIAHGRPINQDLNLLGLATSMADGAVITGTAGGAFALGAIAVPAEAATLAGRLALTSLAGPTGGLAGVLFKVATGQPLGASDGFATVGNMLPLPESIKVQIGLGFVIDQAISAVSNIVSH